MDIKHNTEAATSDRLPLESTAKIREAYSAPKMTEFGTIQKITEHSSGSRCFFFFPR